MSLEALTQLKWWAIGICREHLRNKRKRLLLQGRLKDRLVYIRRSRAREPTDLLIQTNSDVAYTSELPPPRAGMKQNVYFDCFKIPAPSVMTSVPVGALPCLDTISTFARG
jgi:hypothetical protein